jgi:N-acetylglucosaminyl-diphospho-decaprenol L-rhamnosyltransferase
MVSDQSPLDIEFSIVGGSREELLFGCIESINETMTGSPYRWAIVATCNQPESGLAARLKSRFPRIRIVDNPSPRGFAANHNAVLAASRARYVWILNDDLIILPESVDLITRFLDDPQNARVAVVSPRLLNPDGSLQPSTYGFPTMPQIILAHSGLRETRLTDKLLQRLAPVLRNRAGSSRYWAHDRSVAVDTLRGACVAVRMEAVRDAGPMMEVALVGSEETEWHRRMARRGWKVFFFHEASVIHYGSQTVGEGASAHLPEYLKGALHYFRTDRPKALYSVFCISLLCVFGVRAGWAWARRDRSAASTAREYLDVTLNGLRKVAAA